ncbi:alpha/beta fold hydrolase [Hydrogenophaga soli]
MVTLVVLPGLDGTGVPLAPFAAAFGPEVKVVVVTYPNTQPMGYAALESVARTFLPTNEPFFLLGESFSGPIAISIAASKPTGLRGLILCCSFARTPRPWLSWCRPLVSVTPVQALPLGLLSFAVLGRFSSPERREMLTQALRMVHPSVLRARGLAVLRVDVSPLLGRVGVPLLYLQALEDRVVPASAAQWVTATAPSTQVVTFQAPHFLLQVQAGDAARAVERFMAHPGGQAACPSGHAQELQNQ